MPDVDPFIALGFANAMKDLPQYTAQGGAVHVFALDGPAAGSDSAVAVAAQTVAP
jgi:hypothetical protein